MNKAIFYAPCIPTNWEIIPNKYLFTPHSKKVGKEFGNYNLLSLTKSGVILKDIESNEGKLPVSFEGYQTVESNDLIMCLFDLDVSAVFSGLSKYEGMITSAYDVFRVNSLKMLPKFADYWFENVFSRRSYSVYSKSLRHTIAFDSFKNIPTAVPPLDVQTKTVSFLNDKIEAINSLISNETKQIEKLEEYKKAVITKAVTKGLDSNVKMKDSGVEWIGEIPEKWQINRIKYISFSNPDSLSDSESESLIINYVDIGSVSLENGIERTETYSFEDAPSRARRVLKKGDVIISTVRTYLKAIAVVDRNGLIGSTGFCVLRPIVNLIDSNFLGYYCKSNVFTDEISKRSFGISYPAITSTQLISLYLPFPPFKDQQHIAYYLNNVCGKINEIIGIKKSKIEKLQAYKKSLIYEYVTGKKAVEA